MAANIVIVVCIVIIITLGVKGPLRCCTYCCVCLPGRVAGVVSEAVHGDHQHVPHVLEAGLVGVITITARYVTVSWKNAHVI